VTTLPIIPMYNAGDSRQIGMGYAGRGWEDFFHSTTRVKPGVATPREWADRFGCLHIHNPGGIFPEVAADEDTEGATKQFGMKFEQRWLATEIAIKNCAVPYNPDQNPPAVVACRVNWQEFVATAQHFEHHLTCYVGAPHRFARISQESQASWVGRAIEAILPFIIVADTIGLDNTLGSRPAYDPFFNKKTGVIADLIKNINGRGVQVDIEPCQYISDTWLNHCGKIVSERFIRDRTRLNAGKAVWEDRVGKIAKATGKVIDHEPLAIPGTYGEPVKIIAATDYGWDDAKTTAHLEKLHADFPHAKILAYAGHLPQGWAA
jgi:hypothetical protein